MTGPIVEITDIGQLVDVAGGFSQALHNGKTVKVWFDKLDGGRVKFKVGSGTWSPSYGTVVEHG